MNSIKRMMSPAIMVAMITCLLSGASQAMAQDPYVMPDGSFISISGTAVGTTADSFTLDYGRGTIRVDIDDWAWYTETWPVLDGSRVTVYGEIDDGFFEARTIDAYSVYVEDRGTYYYRTAVAGRPLYYDTWISATPIVAGRTVVRGTVTSTTGREFTIDDGVRRLTVDTSEMTYNPLDEFGYQQIEVGDYVSVTGDMDLDFWGNRELVAESVITLIDN